MTEDSWYEIVNRNEPPLQGDFIELCPILSLSTKIGAGDANADIVEYDVVIMSQSCDLQQRKLEFVLLCPYWPLTEFEEKYPTFKSPEVKENLRRGYYFRHHILNKCNLDKYSGVDDYFVVDFRSIYSIPLGELEEIIRNNGPRLRLRSPYREHLSQAFARFFMRVGLPKDIPKFV